jgi:hypothetical protein
MANPDPKAKAPAGQFVDQGGGGRVIRGQPGVDIRDGRPKRNSLGGLREGQTEPETVPHTGAIDTRVPPSFDVSGEVESG